MPELKHAILDELVYEAVRQYVHIWETIELELDLITSIERAKRACAADEAEQEALVDACLERAWARLERARAAAAAADDDPSGGTPLTEMRPPSADALAKGIERAARAGARAAVALDAERAGRGPAAAKLARETA